MAGQETLSSFLLPHYSYPLIPHALAPLHTWPQEILHGAGYFFTQEGNFFSPHFFAPRLRVGGMPLNHSQRGRPGVRKGALCVPPCVGGGGGRSFQPPPSEDHTSSRVHQKNWKRAMQRATRYCPFLSLSLSPKNASRIRRKDSPNIFLV